MKKHLLLVASTLLVPVVVLAADTTINDILREIRTLFAPLPPLIMGASLLAFLWGMVKFVMHADSEEERSKGRLVMIWSVVVLFITVALWGIVAIILGVFGVPGSERCEPPQIGDSNVTVC